MSKPSPDRARILELRAAGWTYGAIAHDVGLSVSRVGQLVRDHEKQAIIAAMRERDRLSEA